MNKKTILTIGLVSGVAIGSFQLGYAANEYVKAVQNKDIKITLNGETQTFKDETTGETQYPLIYNNRTYLPLRNVANLAGLNVSYDSTTNTASLSTSDNKSADRTDAPTKPSGDKMPGGSTNDGSNPPAKPSGDKMPGGSTNDGSNPPAKPSGDKMPGGSTNDGSNPPEKPSDDTTPRQ